MGTSDESGPPLWTPKVLSGGNEKQETKQKYTPGTRLLWHLGENVKETDTEFDILTGTGEVKFKVIGKYEDAGAVIDAFRLMEKVHRNAMRQFLETAKKKGADFSKDPTLSSYDDKESDKLSLFHSWLTMLGLALVTSGHRPWDGKVGSDSESGQPEVAPLAVVKDDGGTGGDTTSN